MIRDFKFYAGGWQIAKSEKNQIVQGKRDKLIHAHFGSVAQPLCYITDHIRTIGSRLDPNDPLLKEVCEVLELPLEKLFIVHIHIDPNKGYDPLITGKKGAVYGYY